MPTKTKSISIVMFIVAVLAAVAGIGYLFREIGDMGPFPWVAIGFLVGAFFGAGLVHLSRVTKETTVQAGQSVGEATKNVREATAGAVKGAGEAVGEAARGVGDAVGSVAAGIGEGVEYAGRGIGDAVDGVGKEIGDAVGGAAEGISKQFSRDEEQSRSADYS